MDEDTFALDSEPEERNKIKIIKGKLLFFVYEKKSKNFFFEKIRRNLTGKKMTYNFFYEGEETQASALSSSPSVKKNKRHF